MESRLEEKSYQDLLGEEQNNDQKQYLTFKVAQETYGLNLQKTKEIIRPSKITVVPNTDKHIKGVINLRGQIVPVVDIKERLNLKIERENSDSNRIIIVELYNYLIGILVNMVNEVVKVHESEIEEVRETTNDVKREYIKGVTRVENNLIVIINLKNLLQTGW